MNSPAKAGFVELLEATMVGQMLERMLNIGRILVDGNEIVNRETIEDFNWSNALSWAGFLDILRMQYDCPRREYHFGAKSPERRFGKAMWNLSCASFFEGCASLIVNLTLKPGVVSPVATGAELRRLPTEVRPDIEAYFGNSMPPFR